MGSRTRDLINTELEFCESGEDPSTVGGMRLNSGALKFKDSAGVYNPRFSNEDHEVVDSLVHDLAETSYVEITYGEDGPSAVTVWQTDAKTNKVREAIISYSGGSVSVVAESHLSNNSKSLSHMVCLRYSHYLFITW